MNEQFLAWFLMAIAVAWLVGLALLLNRPQACIVCQIKEQQKQWDCPSPWVKIWIVQKDSPYKRHFIEGWKHRIGQFKEREEVWYYPLSERIGKKG